MVPLHITPGPWQKLPPQHGSLEPPQLVQIDPLQSKFIPLQKAGPVPALQQAWSF